MVCMARLPPQGGLPPADVAAGAVVEIACDESGFSGSNLLDPATPVITHASVDLGVDEAVALIAALRSRFRFSPSELKSGRFLRSPTAGDAVEWFLTALRGRALVHLVDKEYFLAARIVDLFVGQPSYASGTSLACGDDGTVRGLYRAGRSAGREWTAFLAAFVDLVRVKRRRSPDPRAEERFFLTHDRLGLLPGLDRDRVRAVLIRLCEDDRSIPPPLEPMLPALAETVLFWSGGQRPVLVFHDEQSALTAGRLRRLQQVLRSPAGAALLTGLVTVDSRDDPRVQVADLLAGVARRLSGLRPLQPFVSPASLHDPG
jgi:hypothetical protein